MYKLFKGTVASAKVDFDTFSNERYELLRDYETQ
jgi:hypothetical protein